MYLSAAYVEQHCDYSEPLIQLESHVVSPLNSLGIAKFGYIGTFNASG